jgi:predicted nuclease with RNAse H fold
MIGTDMKKRKKKVIGIDVGAGGEGFHCVALRNGLFEPKHFMKVSEVAKWCEDQDAQVIAIDAPCAWASTGKSRSAERLLEMDGARIQCFKTPTRASAQGHKFYRWVFNGDLLYKNLFPRYRLFDGKNRAGKIVFETFPHAVVCALSGRVIAARPKKASTRRGILQKEGYNDATLANIDFVDAALCALTAEKFLLGRTKSFGDETEGFIVVPAG